jgi:hypothetical protein
MSWWLSQILVHSRRITVGKFIDLYTRFRTERWWSANLFGLAKNRDLFVIKKIHHWTHLCYKDSCFGWEHPVEMDHTWKFLVAKNRDLIAIKKSNTNSKKT